MQNSVAEQIAALSADMASREQSAHADKQNDELLAQMRTMHVDLADAMKVRNNGHRHLPDSEAANVRKV